MDAAQGEEACTGRRLGRCTGEDAASGEEEVGRTQNQEKRTQEDQAGTAQITAKIVVNNWPLQHNRLKFRDDWVAADRLCTGLSTGIGDRRDLAELRVEFNGYDDQCGDVVWKLQSVQSA